MAVITINSYDGSFSVNIPEKEILKKYDVSLIGEMVENFIVDINENFVKLLENFANDKAPEKGNTTDGKVLGQTWFDTSNKVIKFRKNNGFVSNAIKLDGKTITELREYILAGLDTSNTLDITGGEVNGKTNINGALVLFKNIYPSNNDVINIGSKNNKFRNIYLKEDGIVLGEKSKKLRFYPHNYIYTVSNDNADVSKFPVGAIILNQMTGEAIIKKVTGKFGKNNSTFRTLAEDKQNSAQIGGNKFIFMGDIGLIAGGYERGVSWSSSTIDRISISKPSNSVYFANLSYGRRNMGNSMSSGTKAIFQGGYSDYYRHSVRNGKMDYVVFSSPSNAIYFGTFGQENYGSSTATDGVRGIIGPGYNGTSRGSRGHHYMAKFITIETPSNANYFGSIKQGYWGSAVSSGTRGVFGGYSRRGWNSHLEYITIQKLGNSLSFGNTKYHRGPSPNTVTDMNKGVYIGGWNGRWNNNKIEYITISTLGNATYFGSASKRTGMGVGVSNGNIGVSMSMYCDNIMEYITISTPGNTKFFGNLRRNRGSRPGGASGN